MSTSDPPVLPFSVDNTLGALLIGSLVAATFWGVTSIQTYIYYHRYPDDPLFLKLVVVVLWILDTFDACLTSHIAYHYLVTNYMNPKSIVIPVWTLIIHQTVTIVTDVLVRFMFSKRVWGLSSQNIIVTSIVWIVSACDLIIGLVITAKAFQLVSWMQLDDLAPLFYASFVTTFSGDLYLAVVLCYYLFKSRTGFRRTDSLLNTLITYIITTGLLTSVDAILGTILYAVMPTNYIFMAFYFNLAKLYTNSYLALLNARKRLRKRDRPVSIQLSGFSGDPRFASGFTDSSTEHSTPAVLNKASQRDLEIAVHTTVDRMEYSDARAI
ncbi:hypothetical protein L210DRAFT_2478574 [Boletus edulis BED1]|uniref:DUF6534 domain-containing protein n=1 Tax=Boletus edulis BED1 TaxID=1328754 RepID=A0AAD4BPC8_BOLED|nr:hypothetical protein L210DRAFT_2478574 [Boletus edulis BED1]